MGGVRLIPFCGKVRWVVVVLGSFRSVGKGGGGGVRLIPFCGKVRVVVVVLGSFRSVGK